MIRLGLALAIALLPAPASLAATPATAQAPQAPQGARSGANIWSTSYDVRLDVLADGSLDVIETVRLSVGAKPMTWFDRTIPVRRTDGLTNVVARMDGQSVPVSIEHGHRELKVRWDFGPTANATHQFEIRYRALRVLAREIDGPRLVWTALPRRHTYPIDGAEISVFAPTGSIASSVDVSGGEVLPATADRPGVVIAGKDLKRDRTMSIDITFRPNSITPVEPRWFVDQQEQRNMLPAWLAGGATLVVVGIGILIMMFVRLPSAKLPETESAFVSPASEGTVPPALVTWLLSRGQQTAGLAMQSAFFRFVRDEAIVVEKRAGGGRWRRAAFDVMLGPAAASAAGNAAPHEQWLLDKVKSEGAKVDLRRLMMRMTRRSGGFRIALKHDATTRGWMEPERQRARSGLFLTGLVLVVSGLVGSLATLLLLADRLGPAPVVIPAVVFLMGLVYVVVASAMSTLSEPALREAARWQTRVAELKAMMKGGVSGHSPLEFERWFPLAIGAGLGGRWLKAFEPQLTAGGTDLVWLRAMGSPAEAAVSLATIVAVSGASHSGGAGGGAGGGSSGAG